MNKRIKIIERENALQDQEFCNKYKSCFALELLLKGSEYFVKNIKTKIFLLKCDEHIIPFTLNKADYHNAVNCSLYTTFVSYTKLELKKNKRAIWFILRIYTKHIRLDYKTL